MSFNDPYQILGVKETDSMEDIDIVYKNFVKLLHPDKTSSIDGMNKQEQIKFFNMIKYAYKTIKDLRSTEKNMPDYNINYEIGNDFLINQNRGISSEDAKNLNKFNQVFEQNLKKEEQEGISNAYAKGYKNFDKGKDFSKEGNITNIPIYNSDISTTKSKKTKIPNTNLTEYSTPSVFNFSENSGLTYEELGLTNISDFSTVIPGKESLCGSDLMSVYGQNNEPWEKTCERDQHMYSKFNDKGDILHKANKMKQDRSNIYSLPEDKKILKNEEKYKLELEKQEKLRYENLKKRDEYYDKLNMGRLENGLPTRK